MSKDLRPAHNYKGFTIEPIYGGYIITVFGRQGIFYFSGKEGQCITGDPKNARAFRTPEYCHEKIDQILRDHDEWIKSLNGRPIKPTDKLTDSNEPF